MEIDQKFRPAQRIKKQADFKTLVQRGKMVRGDFLAVWVGFCGEASAASKPRLGIMISRQTEPHAAKRNVFKRRIREIFRRQQQRLRPGADILVKARKSSGRISYEQLREDFLKAVKKAEAYL